MHLPVTLKNFKNIFLQFHHELLLILLWLLKPLLTVSWLLGNSHRQTPEMESLLDLSCSTKEKVLLNQKTPWLFKVEQLWEKVSLGFSNTPNMKFKCWPSLLLVTDRGPSLKLWEQCQNFVSGMSRICLLDFWVIVVLCKGVWCSIPAKNQLCKATFNFIKQLSSSLFDIQL